MSGRVAQPDRAAAPDRSALHARLREGADALGVSLSAAQSERLIEYVALLARWNAVYNLTAVREPARMVEAHLLDCIAAWPLLRGCVGRAAAGGAQPVRLLDVGSGAGLPGIVWAVLLDGAEPAAQVTLVDAVDKKVAFQRQAGAALGLARLHCEQARIERFADGPFHVVCSRAYSTLADLVDGTRRLLAPGGCWFAMKGAVPHDEIAALPEDVAATRIERLEVPGLNGAARCVVLLSR